jgi:transposase InsO family protein
MIKKFKNFKISKQQYDDILYYLTTNEIPKNIENSNWKGKISDFRRGCYLFDVKDGELYRNELKVISKDKIFDVIDKEYNNFAYYGRDKLYHLIKNKYFGISRNDVMNYLQKNETNQLHSKQMIKKIVTKPILTSKPRERYQMDFIEIPENVFLNNNFRYILTIIDCFSKYSFCYPLKKRNQRIIAKILDELFAKYKPKILQSDNEFKSKEINEICEKYKVKQIFSSPYKPNSNGCIEKYNQFLKSQIYKYLTNSNSKVWINAVDKIVENYNNSYHSTIKNIPRDVFFDYNRNLTKQTADNIRRRAEKLVDDAQIINKLDKFKFGDYVRVIKVKRSKNEKGYKQNFSKTIYKIKGISYQPSGIRSFRLNNDKVYFANQLVVANEIIKPNQLKIENPKYFDREQHMKKMKKMKN